MTKVSRGALLGVALAISPVLYGQQRPNGQQPQVRHDTAEIQHLMEAFHQAVVRHDGNTVSSLFIKDGSTWFNVLSDEAYAAAKVKNPNVAKVRHSTFEDFSKFVSSSHSSLNPQHANIQIHSDGTIAAVYFDFVFLIDGKPENQGSETWQLVKSVEGWRIVAITYSSYPRS